MPWSRRGTTARSSSSRPSREEPAARAVVAAAGGVHLDGSRIELDPGVHVDLGGIGKGYAAERAAELLALAGPCLVNAGGDIAIRDGVAGRSGS